MKLRHYLTILAVLVFASAPLAVGTPLDDYVAAPDSNYRYSVVKTVSGTGYRAYILEMTSQSWRSAGEVDRTLWKHWLTIVKPVNAVGNKALLWINGGSNGGAAPDSVDKMLVGMALGAGAVVADLRMVPNQPLVFPDGGRPRSEDGIIAYTFDKYMETGDSTWPLLLPMAKSAVRAMDTVQKPLASLDSNPANITEFVVSGGSKRGWTTWLTAAVDKRVVAIAPAVIDVLNMDEQMIRKARHAPGQEADKVHRSLRVSQPVCGDTEVPDKFERRPVLFARLGTVLLPRPAGRKAHPVCPQH